MKTISTRLIRLLTLILIAAFMYNGVHTVYGQDMKPPKPKEASSNLELPEAVVFQELKGEASLPENMNLGFALDLNGVILTGNWDVKGKVRSLDKRTISFLSDEQQQGHLVFRIPKGFQISVEADDRIHIQKLVFGYEAAMGMNFNLQCGDSFDLKSGYYPGESPQTVKIFDHLILQQEEADEKILVESKYEKTFNVDVFVIIDNDKVKLTVNQPKVIRVKRDNYKVIVLQSSKTIPQKGYESALERSGYLLEYLMMKEQKE